MYSALWDTCLFPVLGMVLVRDGPRTVESPFKCGQHVAPPVPRQLETSEENHPGREGGRQRHHRRVHRDSQPVSPFCVFTFVWGCHTESPANSLREVSRVSLQLTAVSGSTDYQFWGWCPLSFKWSRSSAATQRANFRRYSPVDSHDLGATRGRATSSDS